MCVECAAVGRGAECACKAGATLGGAVVHLLVTNDFPPKIGGIQSYLWELWRRLPAGRAVVLTTPHAQSSAFDAAAPMRIVRTRQRWLLPTPILARQVRILAAEVGATLVVLDPAVPVGALGPGLSKRGLPYATVLHGAEVTIPGRVPGTKQWLARTLNAAVHHIAAGGYPLAEADRCAGRPLSATVIPPGVDIQRFRPADEATRATTRARLDLPPLGGPPLVVASSRLVPRKGFDTVIDSALAVAHRFPGITVAVSGAGRDRERLEKHAARAVAASSGNLVVRFLGRTDDATLQALYATADVSAMLCRNRWGGLEQEGFGIVFVEASASGVPVLAGSSGGAAEAVLDGITGLVVPAPVRVAQAAPLLEQLLSRPDVARRMGEAGRRRAEAELAYDVLAHRLDLSLAALEAGQLPPEPGKAVR